MEKKTYRPFTVEPVLNGWVVSIGCHRAVFNTADYLVREIKDYLENPGEAEKKFIANSFANNQTPEVAQTAMGLTRPQAQWSEPFGRWAGQPALDRYPNR